MRDSLFGLSPHGINHMNLSIKPVQLILSHLLIPSLDVSFLSMCACAHNTIFNAYSFIQIHQYTRAYLCTALGICNTTR